MPMHAQPATPASAGSDDHSLSNLVEREIIPRLVASHPLAGKYSGSRGSGEITAEEIDEFAPLSLQVRLIISSIMSKVSSIGASALIR